MTTTTTTTTTNTALSVGESVTLTLPDGRRVEIKNLGFAGRGTQSCRLGVEAPKSVKILRQEVTDRDRPLPAP